MIKLYDDRDICEQDSAGGFYYQHVMAMTAEKLHDKTDIAAELGHRDMRIDCLESGLLEALELIENTAYNGSALVIRLKQLMKG